MSSMPLLRRLAACACLVAGISIPGSDLVHGIAHHEAAHHRDADGGHGQEVVTTAEHGGDHPHAVIGRALTVRLDGAHAAATPARTTVTVEYEVRLQPNVPVVTDSRRWSSTHAPPPSARAPPTV